MKIGIFTDSYLPLPNGVTTAVAKSAQVLQEKGHEVTIIAPRVPGYQEKASNVYTLPSVKFFSTGTRFALQMPNRTLLKIAQMDFDVIHAHNGGPISFLGWQVAKTKNIPYIFTYHTLLTKYTHYLGKLPGTPTFMQLVSKIICKYADYVIAPTGTVKKELTSYGVRRRIHILPTGIKEADYRHDKRYGIRKKLGLSQETKILLHVGRLGKEKSIDFLLNAFAELLKDTTDAVFVLIGGGKEEAALKKQAERLGIAQSVHFLGIFPQEVIPSLYADADVFVFASQTETQGLVILEALASSLPIVAVKHAVFKGILSDGINSFLVPKNPKIFAEKVRQLLKDKALYAAFVKKSAATAHEFSIEKTVEQLEIIYTQLVKEEESKPPSRGRKYFNTFYRLIR